MTNYTLKNYYYYLRMRLTFKGQLFFLFHVKPSIAILTTVSKKTLVKYRSNRELFPKTHLRTKCDQPKVSFAAKHLDP